MNNIGALCRDRLGVPKDSAIPLEWSREAAVKEGVQAVRSVTKSNVGIFPTSSPTIPTDVVHIHCHLDPDTQKEFVLWEDVLQAFDDALHIRDKTRVLPFLKGPDYRP
ncbi:MAG: hypothetical protein J3R72DRAFT_424951 [Linnemannia gamsii]|nr:MAG: hypothetical protein J3R72DRAFT_424951 [Linnemannia gamsii]